MVMEQTSWSARFSQQCNSYFASFPEDRGLSKRIRLSEPCDQVQNCSGPIPLGLPNSSSFLNETQTESSNDRKMSLAEMNARPDGSNRSSIPPESNIFKFPQHPEKLKAVNFPAMSLRIGSWMKESLHEGQIVAKCYYSKKKLVWEILEGYMKSKIEIKWSDISAMRAIYTFNQPGALMLELINPPQYFEENDPKPGKRTSWRTTSDFTGGQASNNRRHYLKFAPGVLEKHYNKLVQSHFQLYNLSHNTCPSMESPFFQIATNNGAETTPRPPRLPPETNPAPQLPPHPPEPFKQTHVRPDSSFTNTTFPPSSSHPQLDQTQMGMHVQLILRRWNDALNDIKPSASRPPAHVQSVSGLSSASANPTTSPSLPLPQPPPSFRPTHVQPPTVFYPASSVSSGQVADIAPAIQANPWEFEEFGDQFLDLPNEEYLAGPAQEPVPLQRWLPIAPENDQLQFQPIQWNSQPQYPVLSQENQMMQAPQLPQSVSIRNSLVASQSLNENQNRNEVTHMNPVPSPLPQYGNDSYWQALLDDN